MKLTLYEMNDNVIQVNGVTDSTGTPVVGAALTASLAPEDGSATAPVTATCGDVEGQPGNYTAPLPAASVPPRGNYRLTVQGSAAGMTVLLVVEAKVVTRTL